MKKMLFLIPLCAFGCSADMVCIENCTGGDVSIKLQKGPCELHEAESKGLGYDDTLPVKMQFTLKDGEQYLLRARDTYKDPIETACGFLVGDIPDVVDIFDYEAKRIERGDFVIENLENDAGNPFQGKAFHSDRTYKITKSTSAPSSPDKKSRKVEKGHLSDGDI